VLSLIDLLAAATVSTRNLSKVHSKVWSKTVASHIGNYFSCFFRACTSALHWLLHFTTAVKCFV